MSSRSFMVRDINNYPFIILRRMRTDFVRENAAKAAKDDILQNGLLQE